MEGEPTQLTPVASWWLKAGTVDQIGIIALGNTVISTSPTPSFGWNANREHWFTKTLAINGVFTQNQSLTLYATNVGGGAGLIQAATDLAKNWSARFLAHTILLDPPNNIDRWTAGPPAQSPQGGFFFQEAGSGTQRPRVLFRVDGNGALIEATWVTAQKYASLSTANQYTLNKQTISSWPTDVAYHYKSP